MVFESLVSDLLNRFIGDYVENLDKSQLKIGIWGGNVVLENLKVKENALSDFDVPFKVKAGQIGKLTLKIPWKNLYNDAVVATLEGLHLLVVPGATMKYDAAKEDRYQQEAKQRELQRIEEALQTAARREKPAEEKKDTFVEKLATQVIKNLQVKISSIHLRYEDDILDPQRPLSIGVTLSELSLQTTDENWKSCILNEAAKIIYKLGCLDCLCVYWNVNSPLFYNKGSWEDIVDQLKSGISSRDQEIPHYQYLFKPIFASSRMCINPTAELELQSPKARLHLEVQDIGLEITKAQYLSLLELLESVDCMVKNAPYRKFRPDAPVHQNAKTWWRYACNSVLEVQIRHSIQMWCWSNIRQHRENLKAYRTAYREKLLSHNKPSPDTEKHIQDLEKVLDVFNITLTRQQAQMEVIRSGQKVVKKKGGGGGGGFFSGFFGKKTKKEEAEEQEERSGFDNLMTAAEKEKLYTAIGYSGSSHNLALPKQYVSVVVSFQLCRTSVTIRDQHHVPEILKIQIIDLSTRISQRPGAQALRVEVALQHWFVTGLQQRGAEPGGGRGGASPSLIASLGDSSSSLLSVVFELNPEEGGADQLLRVQSQPVELIYDALTVNSLADFFHTGGGLDLDVLASATRSKLEEIKEKTAAGLSHIIETRKVLDLRIDLKPSYLLIPKSGFYSDTSDLIVVDFGSLQLTSVEQCVSSPSSSLEEIMDRAYERFNVELRRVQVLYSKSGGGWKSARLQASSVQHILQPMDFTLQLAKCMVDKDARMPRFKVSGELPLLYVKISDQKIHSVLDLVHSIPLPNTGPPSTPTEKVRSFPGARPRPLIFNPAPFLNTMETDSDDDGSEKSPDDELQRSERHDLTDLHFKVEVKEVLLELTRQEDLEKTVLSLSVCQLGAEGKRRSFDLSVAAYLRRVTLDYCDVPDGKNRHLISCSEQQDSDLLKVDYFKADPGGPSFQTLFNNTEQTLKVEFSSLDFLLHTESLLSTISFLSGAVPPRLAAVGERDARRQVEKAEPGRTVCTGAQDGGVFLFKVFAVLGCFHVEVCDHGGSIADIRVQGIDASVLVQAKKTEVFARLRDIVVTDVHPTTVHRKAVSIVGEEVFSFNLLLFPGATLGDGYRDTSRTDGKLTLRLGCIQIVYLHKFLMSLLASFSFQSADEVFVDNFQAAKAAVSAATAQAAEKAASSVRGLAQKSFRLSMDIRLKAPLIIIPQSSSSHNALVMDLGLLTVANSFSLLSVDGYPLPAVVDLMDVRLTQLKLSRTTLTPRSSAHLDVQMLQPINLELSVTRNLSTSWFTRIPGVQVQGELRSLNMSLGEEDLAVLMKILVENIGEGSRDISRDAPGHPTQEKQQVEVLPGRESASNDNEAPPENTVSVLLNFEIKEVLLTLTKPRDQVQVPFLVFQVAHLGINTQVKQYDMVATTFINRIAMKCLEFKDSRGEPLCLVSSSGEAGAELLKVQYYKADRSAPDFSSVYNNTEQMIDVMFMSLDLLLHTEALLSTINFLSAALSSSGETSPERDTRPRTERTSKSTTVTSPAKSDIIDLKVMMSLGAFNVLVCDQSCNMADIKIQGIHGSLLMQGTQTHISARLRDFIVLNVDPKSIHKKAISIVGDEVFSFSLSLTPNATDGAGYADTSRSDGRVKLNVGCIQVVYLHKFLMSLLNFADHFQAAKAAVSAATAQAAEKAASSVRGLAQKSFRLSMDIRLKAPLIIIPQSSSSHNALVMDLGLLTVANSFSLLSVDGYPLPVAVDDTHVQLTQLKLSRTCLDLVSERPGTELLEPVNLQLNIRRNLAASWYHKMVAMEINGDLKPMKVELSQEDLAVLLRILTENLGEAGGLDPPAPRPDSGLQLRVAGAPPTGEGGDPPGTSDEDEDEALVTMQFNFNIKSLALVLFSNTPQQLADPQHQQNLRLGELALHQLKTSGKILRDGSVEVTAVLHSCTLEDLRTGLDRVTSRMVGRRDEDSPEVMMDVTYRQNATQRDVVAILQRLYLCASVEFLMAVADFFLQALPQSQTATAGRLRQNANAGLAESDRLPLRQTTEPRADAKPVSAVRTRLRAVVLDPEVVFVASLMKADAPALTASFQCDVSLQSEPDGSRSLRADLREVKVLACRFLRDQDDHAVTTVLRPCSVTMETRSHPNQPLSGCVTVEEVIVKISPFILNTVMTITAAMTAKQRAEQRKEPQADVSDLWSVMNIYGCNYWFLGVDPATEVTETFRDPDGRSEGETFTAEVKVVQVTLESGFGHRTVPLLLAESTFRGSAQNWSSLLQLRADMSLEVNYFNEVQAVWEPLIERVDAGRRRWNLELEMKNHPVMDRSPVHGDDFVILPEPCTAVSVCSKDTMNITVSQCSLSVLHNLAKAFSESTASTFESSLREKAPFTIRNCLGVPVAVQLSTNLRPVPESILRLPVGHSMNQDQDQESILRLPVGHSMNQDQDQESILRLPAGHSMNQDQDQESILRLPAGHSVDQDQDQESILRLPAGHSVDLQHSAYEPASRGKLSALQRQESRMFNLSIVPSGYSEISSVSVDRPGRVLFTVRSPEDAVSVLLQVDAAEGDKVITLRSALQVMNHFSVPFTVLRYCPVSRCLQTVGQAEPETEFNVTLETYRCQLFVRPAGHLEGQYGVSSSCVAWKEQVHRSAEVRSLLQCPASGGVLPLTVSTLAVPDALRHIASHGEDDWDPAYVLHLHPVAALRNLLPYSLRYMMENSADSYDLQEGSTSDLLNARVSGEILSLALIRYQGRDWQGHLRIQQDMPEFLSLCLVCDSDANMTLDLNVHVARTSGRLLLSLFSPYWIINKTSRVLQYRAEDVSVKHPADYRDIVLFSFRKKNLFSKSKIQLCVSTSSWSDGFSLDTVGSYGCVCCPSNNMDFLVGVRIQMSSFNLTRIVTMSPFYTLVNKSSYELEVGEVSTQTPTQTPTQTYTRWHYISSTECLPLWPDSSCEKLCVRVVGSESSSKSFFFNRQDNGTLLCLDTCGGVIVDVYISDLSTIISFTDYYEGSAPALLLNHTPWATVSYRQSGSAVDHQLKPGEARRFAWDDPAGVRTLSWTCRDHSGELDLLKDEVGQFSYDSLSQVHWVSFLDGRQRVLLFTEDVAVVTKARQAEELEQFQQEVKVSLQHLGLSLVNNATRQEIAYIGIPSSGVVWEMKPRNRWKSFSQKNIDLLEKTFQSQKRGWVTLETNLEVNLSDAIMMMRRPISCPVRRNFLSGIQVEFKQSPHQRCLRAQLHWLQVDNQLPGAIFPIVFHPVPPPKSIALDSEPKPFIDVSVITRFNRHSSVMQFKYFMALVQEMAVKIDQGFLAAILALFTPAADLHTDRQKSRLLERDLQLLQTELTEASLTDPSGLSFFQHFHISPIKLHLSLSLGSGGDEDAAAETAALQSLNLLLKSIGATLTDVDDLIFKLAFFEVRYQFYRRDKLMWAVVRHYTEQFLKQMYVLVLGLDVLGNPFGLIRGLSEGVEAFFYEPFQGAVQGPEEFAEGFVIGVRSLLGHTVGGAAGMVSRITGSVGKGLAAITMDRDFQQKRREEMNRPPRDFGESLAKGGKGLLKGVVGGVTGIVTKPVEGAMKGGAAGFFKGIGKGLVGVVARPTGGIVDMASSTFQGIQRAAESTEEVTKLRPVRLIREDGIIRPYDLTESQGFDLFQRSEIKQLEGEVFRDHYPYPGHRKTTIIITNRRVLCVKEIDFVGHFNREWECWFENFYRPPSVGGTELKIYCKEQKLKFPTRDGSEPVRTVQLRDPQAAQKLQAAISDAQMAQQQHRMARQKSRRFLKPSNKQ